LKSTRFRIIIISPHPALKSSWQKALNIREKACGMVDILLSLLQKVHANRIFKKTIRPKHEKNFTAPLCGVETWTK
jgi:hypothetical protein